LSKVTKIGERLLQTWAQQLRNGIPFQENCGRPRYASKVEVEEIVRRDGQSSYRMKTDFFKKRLHDAAVRSAIKVGKDISEVSLPSDRTVNSEQIM
jgi:hypothetical protein